MGDSPRDKAMGSAFNESGDVYRRAQNYKDPYSAQQKLGELGKLIGLQNQQVDRDFWGEYGRGAGDQTAAFASRGITGGSMLDERNMQLKNLLNKNRLGAKNQIGQNQAANTMGIFNQANVDERAKFDNILRALGMRSGIAGQQSDMTWLDDAMGVVKTGLQVPAVKKWLS